jgi:hypothetical protein
VDPAKLISEKALKHALGRFGNDRVVEALRELTVLRNTLSEGQDFESYLLERESEADSRRDRHLLKVYQVIRVLIQDSPDRQSEIAELVNLINGVSEPATVPHQSPRAGDTPGADDVASQK